MQKSTALILCLNFILVAASSLHSTYEEVMTEHINQLAKASTVMELQEVANGFIRISLMHEEEWLPPYYAALSYTDIGFMSEGEKAEKDAFFEEAEKQLKIATGRSKNPKNPELITLKGYILMGKLNASPVTRGQSLSPRIIQTFSQAVQMDKENPRPLILLARMEFGMAQFMGLNTADACGMVENARELFAQESERLASDSLLPKWGKTLVDQMESVCQ